MKEQAERLDEGHFDQMQQYEQWLQEEAERRWWQQWEDSAAWDWDQQCWTSAHGSSGSWAWSGSTWGAQEPTALSPKQPASSSASPEDKDPDAMTMAKVHEDMGTQPSACRP